MSQAYPRIASQSVCFVMTQVTKDRLQKLLQELEELLRLP
jgi:hypothetical protein